MKLKAKDTVTLFVFIVTLFYRSTQSVIYNDTVIHVHKKGIDTEYCLTEHKTTQVSQYCQSLDFIASKLKNGTRNITIVLESQITLKSAVSFENLESLCIRGASSDWTKLRCHCQNWEDNLGLLFVHIQNLQLSNSGIMQCCGSNKGYNAAIIIRDCSDIIIKNFRIHDNVYSSGLVLVNPHKEVKISYCKFSTNGRKRTKADVSLPGGLHIQFSQHSLTFLVIENSEFRNNKSPTTITGSDLPGFTNDKEWNGKGFGGGMGIALLHNTYSTEIYVLNTTFVNNEAKWGGGLCVYVQEQTYNNTVYVFNSSFINNSARRGGGGLQVRFGKIDQHFKNHISFQRIKFERNQAEFGGGTSITARLVNYITRPGEMISFANCSWYANTGQYSQAMDISPYPFEQSSTGYTPIPLFKDIYVLHNHADTSTYLRITQGVFIITHFSVHFQGKIVFEGNWYSALYLTSGRAIFEKNSMVHFSRNTGIYGGAIAIRGFSAVVVNDISEFLFVNNSATRAGGGIYYKSFDQREYFSGQTCFLEYGGKENNITRRNIHFNFVDNKAILGGLSIYSETIYSCYFAFHEETKSNFKNLRETIFDNIGNFHFDTQRLNTAALGTAARKIQLNAKSPLKAVPGKSLLLPLVMYDEFRSIIHSEFLLRVEGNNMIKLDNHFTTNNKTRIFGPPNQNATLVLSTPQSLFNIELSVEIILLPCPPGFYYQKRFSRCWCSADNISHSYPAILKCDYVNFKAFIKHSYWVGYYPSHCHSAENLYTAFYPSIFNSSETSLRPLTDNSRNLSDFMCGKFREGVLCGMCRAGYSAYYHSREITCGENRLCRFGILFYFISEIVPTLLFFTTVITSGISFSSGSLNGFVFFSQVVDVFSQDLIFSQYVGKTTATINVLDAGHQLIYGIFNINFFAVYPFCLWEGATVMDVLAFKYVTTTFALMLIASIVLIMNYTNKRCPRICKAKCPSKDSSVTHGISTFFIICYGQYTRVSFLILTRTHLQGMSGKRPVPVTYYGGLSYFHNDHLIYAIPAIIFTTVLVVLPPFCLLLYPSLLHLLALCGLSEHPAVNKSLQLLHINHLLPLFDSFQSCYKDKMRFFAGLYLLYRVATFFAYVQREVLPPVFLAVMMLGIHSILQPYKSQKHNLIDTLIFLDIAIINSITEKIKTSLITESDSDIIGLKIIQLGFIYMPISALLLVLSFKISRKLPCVWKSQRQRINEDSEKETVLSPVTSKHSESGPLVELQSPLLKE